MIHKFVNHQGQTISLQRGSTTMTYLLTVISYLTGKSPFLYKTYSGVKVH